MSGIIAGYLSDKGRDDLTRALAETGHEPETVRAGWRKLAANPVERNTFPVERWLADYAVALGVPHSEAFLVVRAVLRAHGDEPDVRSSYEAILEDVRTRARTYRQFSDES